jgi:hypothetical protein
MIDRMNKMTRFLIMMVLAVSLLTCISRTSHAAEMTFQFVNDTERDLSLKLFSRGDSGTHWPGKTRAFSVRPDTAVQQLKIDCVEGEKICWGAWVVTQSVSGQISNSGQRNTRTGTSNYGVGSKNLRECEQCCQVCKAGEMSKIFKLASGAESVDTK